jgi:hypothetical protein
MEIPLRAKVGARDEVTSPEAGRPIWFALKREGPDASRMNVRLSLRILLVLHVLMLVVGVALSFFDGYLLPDSLAEWKDAQLNEDDLSLSDLLLLALWLGWLGGYIVSVVGLFRQQRWAAWLSLGLTVLGLVFTLTEPSVYSGLLAAIDAFALLVQGAILALCFGTDALRPENPAG